MTGTLWDEVVTSALVGTERRPLDPGTAADVAALVETSVERSSSEQTLLTAAAALSAWRNAGLAPSKSNGPPPAAAPPDDRPEASAAAGQLLALLVDGHVRVTGGPDDLLATWLERCAASGHHPPARLLPGLLDRATRVPALRPAVQAAGGPRLAWLAAHNPAWSWAAATDDTSTDVGTAWRTGDTSSRLARLTQLRATDPAAARTLVEETWAGEKAKDRAQIVAVLQDNLGPDDVAFLEAALDDRAAAVRAAAAELLAALPMSPLAHRMADRLRPLVGSTGRFRRKLTVDLPDEPDAAARRDGIDNPPARTKIGRRTWWLIRIVEATPLDFWTDELGHSPADAIAQTPARELIDAWVRAAIRQRSPEWARALLKVRADPQLIRLLAPNDARQVVAGVLDRLADADVNRLLSGLPGPWPEALTERVLARLRLYKGVYAVQPALERLALAGDVAAIPLLERWIAEATEPQAASLHRRLRDVIHTLSIRQAIAQELK